MIAAAMQPPPLPGDKPGRHTTRRAPTAGQPKHTRPVGRVAAAVGVCASFTVAVAALAGGAFTASASASSPVMSPGSIAAFASRPAPLAVPADGRVNGYGFAARVEGVADGPVLASGRAAASGATLWVFALSWQAHQDSSGDVTDPSAVIAGGGVSILVPLSQPYAQAGASSVAAGTEYFVASLPSTSADVVLTMSSGGYSQAFSLTHMAREGSQPAVLYRDTTGWRLKTGLAVQRVLATPYSDGTVTLPKAALVVDMADATLSYFAPDGPADTAADPATAWLVPDLSDPPQPVSDVTHDLQYDSPVTAADMTLQVAG